MWKTCLAQFWRFWEHLPGMAGCHTFWTSPLRREVARMNSVFNADAGARQSKRAYLFALSTLVTFLALFCFVPHAEKQSKLTRVGIAISNVEDKDAVLRNLISGMKGMLERDALNERLLELGSSVPLQSSLLGNENVDQVRRNLMLGALNLEAGGRAPQGGIELVLSFRGDGTDDEVEFVRSIAADLKALLSPSGNQSRANQQVDKLLAGLYEVQQLGRQTRSTVSESSTRLLEDSQRFVGSQNTPTDSIGGASNWELKSLLQQKQATIAEYENNRTQEFERKDEVQKTLLRRIEYLDQEIRRLEQLDRDSRRLAEKDTGVEKAAFVDLAGNSSEGATVGKLQSLRADLALVLSKLDLQQREFEKTLMTVSTLKDLLNREPVDVSLTAPDQESIRAFSQIRLWGLLAVSALVCAVLVFRLDSRAFGVMLDSPQAIEDSLQLPVIGQVLLPGDGLDGRGLKRLSSWIHIWIRSLELVLLVVFVLFFILLLRNSSFSIDWLQDPLELVRNSF